MHSTVQRRLVSASQGPEPTRERSTGEQFTVLKQPQRTLISSSLVSRWTCRVRNLCTKSMILPPISMTFAQDFLGRYF